MSKESLELTNHRENEMTPKKTDFAPLFPVELTNRNSVFEPFWLPLNGKPVINPACRTDNYLKTAFLMENPVISSVAETVSESEKKTNTKVPDSNKTMSPTDPDDDFDAALREMMIKEQPSTPPGATPDDIVRQQTPPLACSEAAVRAAIEAALKKQESEMRSMAEKMVAEAIANERAAAARISANLESSMTDALGQMAAMAKKQLNFATKAAVMHIFGESEKTPEAWETMAAKMADTIGTSAAESRFFCNPLDSDLVREALTRMSERGWTPPAVLTDESVPRGGLRLDHADGGVEDSFERRAAAVVASLDNDHD